MNSHMPITTDTLLSIGIEKPGHRARLLAHLIENQGKSISTLKAGPAMTRKLGGTGLIDFNCCSLPRSTPEQPHFPSLSSWLGSIGLPELYCKFVDAGYEDLE
jgi:hypothetical protein